MKDSKGVEIHDGDVVRISGAYFKCDNGTYLVASTPADPMWNGKELSLRRIRRDGQFASSKSGPSINFWPLTSFVNSRDQRSASDAWNAKYARVEVIGPLKDTSHVRAYFQKILTDQMEELRVLKLRGKTEGDQLVQLMSDSIGHNRKVLERIGDCDEA